MKINLFYGIFLQNSTENCIDFLFNSFITVDLFIIIKMNLEQIIKNQQLKKNLEKRK